MLSRCGEIYHSHLGNLLYSSLTPREEKNILSLVCFKVRFLCLYIRIQPVYVVELQKSSNLYKNLNFRGQFGTFTETLSSIHLLE